MLQVILPIADVAVSVNEMLRTFSMHLTLEEIALVPGFIRPYHCTFAFHIIILEFALVQFSGVCKKVLSISMELSVNKVALIIPTFELKASIP